MTNSLDLAALTVAGPFWTADLTVVTLEAPERNLALRQLFLDRQPRQVAGASQVLAPGTLLALGCAGRVVVRPGPPAQAQAYEWCRDPNAALPPLVTFDDVARAVQSGAVSLLVLAADPSAWGAGAAEKPPALTCLAGEISLDHLVPQGDSVSALEAALGLQPPEAADIRPPGRLSVHASGLSILARAALPWLPAPANLITGPFQLVQVRAPDKQAEAAPDFLLDLEVERLTAVERAAWVAAARQLSRAVNPTYPLNGDIPRTAVVPEWVTLELIDPTVPPRIFWPIPQWGAVGNLSFPAGAMNLLLSDHQPYVADRAPTSLARVLPDQVSIVARADGWLTIVATSGAALPSQGGQADPPPDSAIYRYRAGDQHGETLRFSAITTAFSPIETAEAIRIAQELPVPEWDRQGDVPLAEPIIWGFIPLDDGWVQLPVLNLSEQLYIDAGIVQPAVAALAAGPARQRAAMQGAVSFSNRRSDGTLNDPAEHPWSVTFGAAARVAGVWNLAPGGPAGFSLEQIDLVISQPELYASGLLWLSRGRPTVADALPNFDDWIGGLQPLPLRRVRTREVEGGQTVADDLFPALLVCNLETLDLAVSAPGGDPQLGSWSLGYELADPQVVVGPPPAKGKPAPVASLVERLFRGAPEEDVAPLLSGDLFSRFETLAWRRHPVLPTVQVLPLTQTKDPPNTPSASRQLAPFALPTRPGDERVVQLPAGWRFGVQTADTGARSGATTWPALLSAVFPAREWRTLPDLPMAVLSLPGLILDPSAFTAGSGLLVEDSPLPLQYRYDLPYTDEVQALAELPEVLQQRGEVSPLPDDPPPQPPQPLLRPAYAAHWGRLAEQASLAAADVVEALGKAGEQVVVRNLIEPYHWPVDPQVDLSTYPGTLTLREPGADDGGLMLTGAADAPDAAGAVVPGAGNAALMGISGSFAVGTTGELSLAPGSAGALQVLAGSMAAGRDGGSMRDQRGLRRAATTALPRLLVTSVALEQAPGQSASIGLTTTLAPQTLAIADDHAWELWFRDLPVLGDQFTCALTRSPQHQDINDPEARGREYNHLAGYEWRIADTRTPTEETPVLRLCGLDFYPLTLDAVTIAGGAILAVAIVGRLQLPLEGKPGELTELNNAVRVTFSGEKLALTSVAAVEPDENQPGGEWPLALAGDELGAAPRLTWVDVSYDPGEHALTLVGARLHFALFDVAWRLGLPAGAAHFTEDWTRLDLVPELAPSDLAVAPAACALTLVRPETGGGDAEAHAVSLDLALRLRTVRQPGADGQPADHHAFSATVRFALLPEALPTVRQATLFADIDLVDERESFQLAVHGGTLQFAWQRWKTVPSGLTLLPGMPLATDDSPGCAVVSFRASPGETAPQFELRLAYVEAIVHTRWGAFLQSDSRRASAEHTAVFGSSAGDMVVGYTAHLLADAGADTSGVTAAADLAWDEQLLFNGFLELKSLISWPVAMAFDPADGVLTLPALEQDPARQLTHLRHTMRVLFNQHTPPEGTLRLAVAADTLFEPVPTRPWQLLAVVEHQLVEVGPIGPAGDDQPVPLGADRRWTVSQEVRLLHPDVFVSFLEQLGDPDLRTVDPIVGLAPLTDRAEGYFAQEVRARLGAALARRAELGACLLVEASAPHWLRPARPDATQPTALQYLPGGSQQAILSGPDDYAAGPPEAAEGGWLLLSTPFLGRLQPAALDGAVLEPDQLLAGDPILMLRRSLTDGAGTPDSLLLALTHWSYGAPATVRLSHLETAAGRSWTRLDPLSLDENWFRLNTPLAEVQPARLASITAALADTPARSGRALALRRSFDTLRPYVPPGDPAEAGLPGGRTYQVPEEVTSAELVWRQQSLFVPNAVTRVGAASAPAVTRGLQLLYTFAEGQGTTITDRSGSDEPYPLRIANPSAVQWLPGGGLRVTAPTLIRGDGPPARLIAACRSTNEISVEVWLRPGVVSLPEPGVPARIVTISEGTERRNLTMQQGLWLQPESNFYHVRLRTTATDLNGEPPGQTRPPLPLGTPVGSLSLQRTHLVFTREASGRQRIYLDGRIQAEAVVDGDFSNWDTKYPLMLADELGGSRAWRGSFAMVALYSQALTAEEVARNYAVGRSGGWYTTAALLASGNILAPAPAAERAPRRFVGATLLPAWLQVTVGRDAPPLANPQPLGFAVSPYLSLSFRRRPATRTLAIVAAELVCVDALVGSLRPVATRFFAVDSPDAADAIATTVEDWAREQHRLLAPESAAALVRLREIYRRGESGEEQAETAVLTTGYRFMLVTRLSLPASLRGRVTPLRTSARRLRFRAGQYGGPKLPQDAAQFELAPPQTTGVQPVVLAARPEPEAQAGAAATTWPWGLSALRYSVRYTERQRGIVGVQGGDGGAMTLWWQSFQHIVQFRSALRETPLFALPLADEPLFQPGTVAAAIRAAFAAARFPLGEASVVMPAPDSNGWIIADRENRVRYRVRPAATDLQVMRLAAPAAGLPPLFRARQITSLLPVLPAVPLPTDDLARWLLPDEPDAPRRRYWQPVLPGGLRYVLAGTRPGVMVATRAAVTSQPLSLGAQQAPTAGWERGTEAASAPTMGQRSAYVSGSVPVQHRVPRPVALPPNRRGREDVALRTWASYFAPEQNVLVSLRPVDETFYAASDEQAARRLRLRLLDPEYGVVPAEWDGRLLLEATTEVALSRDNLAATLLVGRTRFPLRVEASDQPARPAGSSDAAGGLACICRPRSEQDREAIRRQIAALGRAGTLLLEVAVGPRGGNPSADPVWPFVQMLSLNMRTADPDALPMPLQPAFIHFEDPEYNRALASQPGRAERLLKLPRATDNQFGLFTLTLATDRRAYNPDSSLALIYQFDQAKDGLEAFKVRFERVTKDGVADELTYAGEAPVANLELLQLRLDQLRREDVPGQPALAPDDRLRIVLLGEDQKWGQYRFPGSQAEPEELVRIEVDIVAEPVIPAPEAAYALLRRQELNSQQQVACERFAWGPDATRIDLVAKGDLLDGVVRRRAVFQWQDNARRGTVIGYAIQKITASGSTHIPLTWERDPTQDAG